MTVSAAAEYIGTSISTVQRRADAWEAGNRSPYALKSTRAGWVGGHRRDRLIDPTDAERARLQRHGELPADVDAEQYARQRGTGRHHNP